MNLCFATWALVAATTFSAFAGAPHHDLPLLTVVNQSGDAVYLKPTPGPGVGTIAIDAVDPLLALSSAASYPFGGHALKTTPKLFIRDGHELTLAVLGVGDAYKEAAFTVIDSDHPDQPVEIEVTVKGGISVMAMKNEDRIEYDRIKYRVIIKPAKN